MPEDRFRIIADREGNLERTVVAVEPESLVSGMSAESGLPFVSIILDAAWPLDPEKRLPAGLRQRAVNVVFRPVREFAGGDAFALRPAAARGSLPPDATGQTVAPDLLLGGEVRLGEGLPALEDLEAEVRSGASGGPAGDGATGEARKSVHLTWQNGAAYDAARIVRNGEHLAELPGEAREFTDPAVPEGIFTYKVVAVRGRQTSFPQAAFLTTLSPPGAFLRGDTSRDGKVNLTDPVRTLEILFRTGGELPCEEAADANDDGTLNLTDAVFTLRYLFRGGAVIRSPGTRYPWFDPTPDPLACRE